MNGAIRQDIWRCTAADVITLAAQYFTFTVPAGHSFKIVRVVKEAVVGGTSTTHGVAITDSRVGASDPFTFPGQPGILYLSSDPSTSPPTADTVTTVNRFIDEVPAQPIAGTPKNAGDRTIRIWHCHDNSDGDCEIHVYVELWESHLWEILK